MLEPIKKVYILVLCVFDRLYYFDPKSITIFREQIDSVNISTKGDFCLYDRYFNYMNKRENNYGPHNQRLSQ